MKRCGQFWSTAGDEAPLALEVFELNKFSLFPASNYVAIAGDLTIGDGNNLPGTDFVRLLTDDQIADTADVGRVHDSAFPWRFPGGDGPLTRL